MKRTVLTIALLMTTAALAAETATVTLSSGDCAKLVQHVPADDVTYRPGVDVRGKPVVPADLGGGSAITMPEEIHIQIGVDLADRLALRNSRLTPPPTPGLPGPPSAQPTTRPALPFEGKGHVGVLSVKGNDVFWNGERIAPQDEVLLAEACRKGLSDAGIILPTHKPESPKP
jgi:hypothetical protein